MRTDCVSSRGEANFMPRSAGAARSRCGSWGEMDPQFRGSVQWTRTRIRCHVIKFQRPVFRMHVPPAHRNVNREPAASAANSPWRQPWRRVKVQKMSHIEVSLRRVRPPKEGFSMRGDSLLSCHPKVTSLLAHDGEIQMKLAVC